MFIRGISSLLSLLCLLNLSARLRGSAHDPTIWWLDLRTFPVWIAVAIEIVAIIAFAVIAIGNRARTTVRRIAAGTLLLLAIVGVINSMNFFRIAAGGRIAPAIWFPLSLIFAVLLAVLAWRTTSAARFETTCRGRRRWMRFAAGFATAAVALPLAQMLFFGTTDYRRHADAIVVFGAAVDKDGRPSLALADRVETACKLYHEGRAPLLIFSGGPGPGHVDEADAMRALAIRRGVPADAIVLDHAGITTDATVRNALPILEAHHASRVLTVSHAYHLPRVKLAFQSAGREVFTVPAHESRSMARMPYFVARETAALWLYYGRSIVRS